jgi:hypothetical protein
MDNFKCDTDWMDGARLELGEIHDLIAKVHEVGKELLHAIESGEEWQGSAHLAGAAFLGLTVELNRQVGSSEGGPVQQAQEGVDFYLKEDDAFYDGWYDYQEVSKI